MTLTYNPNLAKVQVDPCGKKMSKAKQFRCESVDSRADIRTLQIYYLHAVHYKMTF